MSTRISSKTGSAASSAGGRRPHWCRTAASPSVFSATVLPPVFGPLITSARSEPSSRSIGTADGPVEQRVARPAQHDFVALSHERSPPAAREAAAGEREVELCGGAHERDERLGLRGDERGEVAQDPRDLVALGDLGLAQPVRVVDGRERLDEQRLARAGGVVHDPRHAPPGRRLQRQHGAAAALGHEVVLEVLGDGRVVRDLAQALGQPPAALAQLAAQAAQRRRGRVLQVGAVLLDRAPDLLGDREQRRVDPGDELEQRRDLVPLGERAARRHAGANRALDLRERAGVERAAAGREIGRLAHVGSAAQVGLGRLVEQRDRLGRLLLAEPHLLGVRRRAEGFGQQGSRLARRGPGQPGQDRGELEQLEVVLSHGASVRPGRPLYRHPVGV